MERKEKIYYLILIAGSILSTIIWTSYAYNAYANFQYFYYDIGIALQSLYLTANHPAIVQGLQYIVNANHISPDETLFILPLFELYRSPLTPIFIEALVLSFTSVLIFFVAKDLTGRSGLSFVLGMVYLINPGMQGMLYFVFHEEFLIIPLAIATFYFYMKLDRKLFYLSLLLLLAVMDSVVFIVAALGAGLLYYEIVHDKDVKARRERLKLSASIIILSFAALAVYVAYSNLLVSQYSTGYGSLPLWAYVHQFDSGTIDRIAPGLLPVSPLASNAGAAVNVSYPLDSLTISYMILFLIIGIFAFGIGALSDPFLTILLTAPSIGEVILLRDLVFGSTFFQYYSYVLGGSIIAAILGTVMINNGQGMLRGFIRSKAGKNKLIGISVKSALFVSWALFLVFIMIREPFQTQPVQQCYLQLDSVIAKIPQNASLATMDRITPHVADHPYLYVPGISWINLTNETPKPEYVLIDTSSCFSGLYYNETYVLENYTAANDYHIVAQNGSAELWGLNTSA